MTNGLMMRGSTRNILAPTCTKASEGDELLGDCDVIALASHGPDGLQRWVMGSVTEQVLRDTKLPLLVVPSLVQRMPARKEQTEEEDMGTGEQDTLDVFSSVR